MFPAVSGPTSTTVGGGATTFESPDWATDPRPGAFFLEVMKDGVGIDQLPLERKATVFGRQAPLCHFVLDHPSVSRQHAALVYHKNGRYGPRPACVIVELAHVLPQLSCCLHR